MDSTLYQVNAQSAPGDPRMAPLYALAVSAGAPADLARKIRAGLPHLCLVVIRDDCICDLTRIKLTVRHNIPFNSR